MDSFKGHVKMVDTEYASFKKKCQMDNANAKFVLINDAGQENVVHKNSFFLLFSGENCD